MHICTVKTPQYAQDYIFKANAWNAESIIHTASNIKFITLENDGNFQKDVL